MTIEAVDFNLDDDTPIRKVSEGQAKKKEDYKYLIQDKINQIKNEEKRQEFSDELEKQESMSGIIKVSGDVQKEIVNEEYVRQMLEKKRGKK